MSATGLSRLLLVEIVVLALATSASFYVVSYLFSPRIGLVSVPDSEIAGLIRVSKILAWTSVSSFIVAILAAAGLSGKKMTLELSVTAAGMLTVLVLVALGSTCWYFFVVTSVFAR